MLHRRDSGEDKPNRTAGFRAGQLGVICLVMLAISCTRPPRTNHKLSETNIVASVAELAQLHPEHFANPYTFVILVDSSPCGKFLQETPYWRDWQRSALGAGWGFLFATSQADSAGLVWAAKLDSVDAPVLVLPGCRDYLQELKLPRGTVPLKLLLDSTMNVRHLWNSATDTASCRIMTEQIDSVCHL